MALPITLAEKEEIGALRAVFEQEWRTEFEDDLYLVRRLRARDHNVERAAQMLRDTVAWLKQPKNVITMENYKPADVLKKYFPGGYYGHDKEGSPLFINPIGRADIKGLRRSASEGDIIDYQLHEMERLYREIFPKRSEEEGFPVTQYVSIYDFKDFGPVHISKIGRDTILEIIKRCGDYYPETLKVGFFINTPGLLPVVWKILTPFLAEATRNKLYVLGSDYQGVLLEHCEPQHLPACYGGTLTDPNGDPYCSSYICWGGKVPKDYYLKKKDSMVEVMLRRGKKIQREYIFSRPGGQLSWKFYTENDDIGFSISFTRTGSEESQVLERYRRFNFKLIPAMGELEVPGPGTCVVLFDNSYSWTRNKRLFYRIDKLDEEDPHTTVTSNESNEEDSESRRSD